MKTKAKSKAKPTRRTMSAANFAALKEAVRQMVAIENGETTPEAVGARVTKVSPPPSAAAIRATLDITQKEFAALLNVSVRTLQDWEIGRRKPDGTARTLLRVAAYAPQTVLEALRTA